MSIDIVNLIENNPITKLSGDCQSKLIEKVKNHFSNYEQQLFLFNFYCYLKYNTTNDFVIDLDNVWNWLDFSQKDASKRVLEKNFIINKDYKIFAPQVGGAKNRGGHNREIIMLTVNTFKKFCLKACTKKADEIHEYFIKLENIMFEITTEECEELKVKMQQIEDKNVELCEKIIRQKERILLDEYNSGSLIYIIKVKSYCDGSYVIKIGQSTKGINNRYNEHKTNYDECLLLNCFSVDKSRDFESFLHRRPEIYSNKVTNLVGHERENELFLIGTNLTYQMLLKIINDNISNYNYTVRELLLENKILKETHLNDNINNSSMYNGNELIELKNTIKQLSNEIISLKNSNQQIINKLNNQDIKLVTGFNQQIPQLGPRLQKINPETLQLVKVYESVTESMNENKDIKRPSIMKAIRENTIYCGFRWLLVERNLDPNIIHNIQHTKETKIQNVGYIAKLNSNKTEILNVYLDRKTASNLNGYKSLSLFENCVKNNTILNEHYYILYNNCEQELIHNFEKNNGIPLLYKNGIGQYDMKNKLIREFTCKYDCIKELKMSDKTLTKALIHKVPYNNYCYKELGNKLKMI